jgi:AcrR family transcriptional regulator
MSGKAKKAAPPELGRKGAYVLRNRAALLRSTREVLATKGKSATIEDIAEHAEVAVSTVYKHFKDKDALISATILAAFAEWEPWAMSFAEDFSDPLEQFVMPMRVFVRLNQTHPHNAQTLVNYFDVIAQIVPQLQATMLGHVKTLTKAKILTISNPEIAAKVIEIIGSPKIQRTLYATTGGQSGHRSAWLDSDLNAFTNNFYANTLENMDNSYLRPRFAGFVEVQTDSGDVLAEAVYGKISPEKAIQGINQIYQDKLKKWSDFQ